MMQFSGTPEEKWKELCDSSFNVASLPVYVVSTLPGTSSESNCTFVIEDPWGYKRAISRIASFPVAMAFDPRYALSVSDAQLCMGVFDAYVHVLEQCIRPDSRDLTNDGLCISIVSTLLYLHEKIIDGSFTSGDLVKFSRVSSIILDGFSLARGLPVDAVTHEIATFLSRHFKMQHAATLACVLPEYLEHESCVGKYNRFRHVMKESVSALDSFRGRNVHRDFNLRDHIAGAGLIGCAYELKVDGDFEAAIGAFVNERIGFWESKGVSAPSVRQILDKVLKTINA